MNIGNSVPAPASFTPAPLRNRIRVELHAPPAEVWALVGDPARYPEYSAGIERVDVEEDSPGAILGYTCHFRPEPGGDMGMSHRERIRWYALYLGYASLAEEPNAFGLLNSLTLVTLEATGEGTLLEWSQYFDSADAAMHQAIFDQALADIAERLRARFGAGRRRP